MATEAWAVGSYEDDATSARNTLILRWDGTSWSQIPSPNPTSTHNHLTGVSVVSAADAWAVGSYEDDATGSSRSLILRWDGATWSQLDGPSPGTDAHLMSVNAVSPTDAWAVGNYEGGGYDRTLTLRWDGTRWSRVKSPSPNHHYNILSGVSTLSTTDAWAIGSAGVRRHESLVLHWDGERWSRVASPSPSVRPLLTGVSISAATDAWAVGGSCCNRALILRWDGIRWSRVRSPSRGGADDDHFLNGASAVSEGEAWAVGRACRRDQSDEPDTFRCRTLTLHWDGSRWSRIRSPSPSSLVMEVNSGIPNELTAASAISATDAWAVGASIDDASGAYETLILHWDGIAWSQT